MNKNKWITYPIRVNCCSFVKEYKFNKPVKSITINITSMGWYHLYIDEVRIDQDVFSPGWTNFKKRIQYQTYNLENKQHFLLKVDLAEGWGGGDRFAWANGNFFLYYPLALNYQLIVSYLDETKSIFYSDTSMKVYTNKYIDSSIYYGEQVDIFRKPELLGHAKKIDIDTKIIPQEGARIVYGERFKALKMWQDPKGNTLIDFGQNIAGIIEIQIKGKKGDVISYQPCEVLDKDGVFYNDNYRKCKNSIYSFVLSGNEDLLKSDFSFLGGRYIRLIDFPKYVKKENFTAVMVHSDIKQTCNFITGNPKINRLYQNIKYGQLSNYIDVPTDCPQRDERLGWTGDTQVFCKTAAIQFNVHDFFRKWIHDLMTDQKENGMIPSIVPIVQTHADWDNVSTGWGDAATVVPYQIYMAYQDKQLLKESIPMMEKWVEFLSNNYLIDKPYIVKLKGDYYGDWLALDKKEDKITHNYIGLTDLSLIDTAFYAYSISLLIKCMKFLKMNCSNYEILLDNVKKAYQKEFIENHHMKGRKVKLFSDIEGGQTCYSQTGLVLTLHFDLCSKEDRKYLVKDLSHLIRECHTKLTTGFLGTPYLLHALSENNKTKIAYDLLFQEDFPSWLYSINKGATTMWEHYDGIKKDGSIIHPNMNSFNHYAYGSIFDWMFENCAGIKVVKPGYKQIIIEPKVDKRLGFVNCYYDSKFGRIVSNWMIKDNNISFEIIVPKGIKAKIILPNKKRIMLYDGGNVNKTISLN